MKKICRILFVFILFLSILGCEEKKYKVDYKEAKDSYVNAKDEYAKGEEVKLIFDDVEDDTVYTFYVDGEKTESKYDGNGYPITFTMPDHDIIIDYTKKKEETKNSETEKESEKKEDVLTNIENPESDIDEETLAGCSFAIAYIGSYYTDDEWNSLYAQYRNDADLNHIVTVYEEDTDMQCYLVIPSDTEKMTVQRWDNWDKEVIETLYEDNSGAAFILRCPDAYGTPTAKVVAISDTYGTVEIYPALELTSGSIRLGNTMSVNDFTGNDVIKPMYMQSLFDRMMNMFPDKEITTMWDQDIEGRYFAVFRVGEDDYYAIKPGEDTTAYHSTDFMNWAEYYY